MAEIPMPISPDDITGLAQTLDGLDLPEGQKALLSGLIAVATGALAVEPEVSVDVVEPLPSFQDQFATAFTPGEVADIDATTGGAQGVKVTHHAKIGRA